MAKLTAPPSVQARHLTLKRQGALRTTQAAGEVPQARAGAMVVAKRRELASGGNVTRLVSLQQFLIEKGPPVRTPLMRGEVEVPWKTVPDAATGQPQPERLLKADGGFSTTVTPPFLNRILAPYQKYGSNLGASEVYALDTLYELGESALNSSHAKLTSGYNPNAVDVPGHRDYAHMSERQRQTYTRFHELWGQLGEGMQRIAYDLVFELTRPGYDKPMTVAGVGREISSYQDERRAIGAAVAGLRLLAWRIMQISKQEHKGGSRKKTAPNGTNVCD